jgi:regulator of RNase E activity RraA
MVINPGDLIIGDDDGLLCVPRQEAETIYRAAKAKNDAEEKQMEAIKAGTSDRSWVDAALLRLGCEIIE